MKQLTALLIIVMISVISTTAQNTQTQITTDSAQWAAIAQIVKQQKSTDSSQWAYMSLIVHKLLPQYVQRFTFDSLTNTLQQNAPWGFPNFGATTGENRELINTGRNKGGVPLTRPITRNPPKLHKYEPRDEGPYLLAWDSRSQGYRIAYIDEDRDDVEWLETFEGFQGFETVHLAMGRASSTLFFTKKEAVDAIHSHWKQVQNQQRQNHIDLPEHDPKLQQTTSL